MNSYHDNYSVPKIKDLYPEVKLVHISLKITYENAAASMAKIKEYTYKLIPEDLLDFKKECENQTCTGFGLDLTPFISTAILSHKEVVGELKWIEQ